MFHFSRYRSGGEAVRAQKQKSGGFALVRFTDRQANAVRCYHRCVQLAVPIPGEDSAQARKATGTWQRVLSSPSLIVASALALRLILLWLSHRGEDPAHPRLFTVGLEAHLVAQNLANGKGFFGPYPGYNLPTACLAPVYPFLWAIGNKLFHLQFGASTVFAQLMNCVFSAATCWPILSIGKKLFGVRVGLASAWVWAFFPYAILYSLEWTWDQCLSALLLAVIVWVTYLLRESARSIALTGYGLLWAVATLTNPALCVLLPFFLGWLMLRHGAGRALPLASAAKVFAIFILAIVPWTIRNYYEVGGFVFVKSNFGMELWLGNNPSVQHVDSQQYNAMSDKNQVMLLILNGEPNYNRAKESEAVAYIKAHPGIFVEHLAKCFADTWAAIYDSYREPWIKIFHLSRANIWFCLSFSLLSVAGMVLAVRFSWQMVLPLAICMVIFPISYYVTHTSLRYRHPIDPFLVIFTVSLFARLFGARTTPLRHDSAALSPAQ
jgi:hypothetical protein